MMHTARQTVAGGSAALRMQTRNSFLASLKNLKKRSKEDVLAFDASGEDTIVRSTAEPWMYRVLHEESIGASRSVELATAHKLEFQRLYIPEAKLPAHDDHLKLGTNAKLVSDHTFHYANPAPYTHEARKIFKKETFWAQDSLRQQLDGTFDPQTRADLNTKLREDVPVPSLDWNCQFPMWNPRNSSPPSPTKGRMMYMYSLAKGGAYVFKKSQKGVYSSRGYTFRGLA